MSTSGQRLPSLLLQSAIHTESTIGIHIAQKQQEDFFSNPRSSSWSPKSAGQPPFLKCSEWWPQAVPADYKCSRYVNDSKLIEGRDHVPGSVPSFHVGVFSSQLSYGNNPGEGERHRTHQVPVPPPTGPDLSCLFGFKCTVSNIPLKCQERHKTLECLQSKSRQSWLLLYSHYSHCNQKHRWKEAVLSYVGWNEQYVMCALPVR